MKRVIYLAIGLYLMDTTFAMSQRICIRKEAESESVTVSCNGRMHEVGVGESVNFDDFSSGRWDGTTFSLSSNTVMGSTNISSKDIPIVFDSFLSEKCKVSAPSLRILGETRISDFTAEFARASENILDIVGTLITKCFDTLGSVVINGGINLLEDGILRLRGIRGNDSLTINGRLSSVGELKVDTTKSLIAKVINNGEISSESGVISFLTHDFFNGEQGRIIGESAFFQLRGQFQNDGTLELNRFSITLPSSMTAIANSGFNPVNFIQKGRCIVHEDASLACNIESFGQTQIKHLIFPYVSMLNICGGRTVLDRVSGRVSIVQAKEGARATIGTLEDGADFVESSGSQLTIAKLHSDRKSIFTAKSRGKTNIGEARTPSSFMYSDDGTLKISKLEGKSSALIRGTAGLNLKRASELTSLVSTDDAKARIEESKIDNVHMLGSKKNSFIGTQVISFNNRARLEAIDTQTMRLDNRGKATFSGNTITEKMNNYGKAIFKNGDHRIGIYSGKNDKSKIKVQGENAVGEEAVASDAHIVLKDGRANVSVQKMRGSGIIEASQQTYRQIIPTAFYTKGDVDVFTDYIPKPTEIPLHNDGDFRIIVNMNRDYINSSNINYRDVLFFMHMNGHRWENRAAFIAGGLGVDNASVFGNYDGNVYLERMLNIQAGRFFNISHPLARENGRLVDVWPDWWAHLVYYCPATYYSANPHTGIAVMDGNIVLKSNSDITNRFSNIYAGGTLTATSKGTFENTVASIIALGREKSEITAPSILNTCLPAVLRQGSAHAERTAGWGWNRRTKHAYHRTAEWITQSPGSVMLFGGDLNLIGHTNNFGSKILSRGLFYGNVESRSLFENAAKHGSLGAVLEGDNLQFYSPLIFVHEDRFITVE